jgi:hypothetical protein
MLADKKWDPVWATVVQVTDALRFDGSSVARRLLGAKDRIALFRILQEIQSDETWFRRWVELFTTPDQTAATPQMIEQLHEDDSVTSWTLANVLRRCTFGASVLDALIVTASDSSAVVRWRTVHVLGAHPSPRAFEAVQARITDEDQWVQYGAARSAVEMAALTHDPAMRPYIISALIKLAQSGRLSQSALRELSRALDIRPQPPGWPLAVGPLIQQLIGLSQTAAEQDRWGQVMTSIASAESA